LSQESRLSQVFQASHFNMHRHKWILKKQTSVFATNINHYECECGEKKDTYQPWGFPKEIDLKKDDKPIHSNKVSNNL
ncbi:MAG: hypothetical protein ABIK92_04570, partial [Pseudomonadota bacterium]